MSTSIYMQKNQRLETVARRDANLIKIIDLDSYKVAQVVVKRYQEEVLGNLGLEVEEVGEYYECMHIINNKIDEFIKSNPEYGI